MGIFDGVLGKVKSDLEWKAGQAISDTVVKGASKAVKKDGPGGAANACTKCKKPLPDPRPKFCPNCGFLLTVTCSKCNAEYPTGTNFCTGCGTKL